MRVKVSLILKNESLLTGSISMNVEINSELDRVSIISPHLYFSFQGMIANYAIYEKISIGVFIDDVSFLPHPSQALLSSYPRG